MGIRLLPAMRLQAVALLTRTKLAPTQRGK
jgi:hypothetical protein